MSPLLSQQPKETSVNIASPLYGRLWGVDGKESLVGMAIGLVCNVKVGRVGLVQRAQAVYGGYCHQPLEKEHLRVILLIGRTLPSSFADGYVVSISDVNSIHNR